MKKVLLISTAEIISNSFIQENIDVKILAKTLSIAQEVGLRAIIGNTLYNNVIDAVYNNAVSGTPIDTLYTDLITAAKPYLIVKTTADFIILNNYKITDKGVLKLNDNSANNLTEGDLQAVKDYYDNLISTYKTDLLDFLSASNLIDAHNDIQITSESTGWFLGIPVDMCVVQDEIQTIDVIDYIQPTVGTFNYQELYLLRNVLLIAIEDIISNSVIQDNVDTKLLAKTIQTVQEVYLKAILTDKLYYGLLDAVYQNVLSGSTIAPLYADLTTLVKPYLINKVVAEFIIPNNYKITQKGILKLSDNSATPISEGDLQAVKDYYDNISTTYKKELIEYLNKYNLVQCGDDEIGSDASGWFLGGHYNGTGFNLDIQNTYGKDTYTTNVAFANDTLTLTDNNGDTLSTPINTFNSLLSTTISASTYYNLPSVSGLYLPLSGGTMDDNAIIQFNNNSQLKEGNYDFGGQGGISQICSVGYENNWQSGFNHIFDNNGFIRESRYCFNIIPDNTFDSSLRFKVDSRWVLDNGDTYICSDASIGAAVWTLYSPGAQTNPTSTYIPVNSGGTFQDSFIKQEGDILSVQKDFGDGVYGNRGFIFDLQNNFYQIGGSEEFLLDIPNDIFSIATNGEGNLIQFSYNNSLRIIQNGIGLTINDSHLIKLGDENDTLNESVHLIIDTSEKLISTLSPYSDNGGISYKGFYQVFSDNYFVNCGIGNFTAENGNGETLWGLTIFQDASTNFIGLGNSTSGDGLFIDGYNTTLGYPSNVQLIIDGSEQLISTLSSYSLGSGIGYKGFYQIFSSNTISYDSFGLGSFTSSDGQGDTDWGLSINKNDITHNIVLGSSLSGEGLMINDGITTLGYSNTAQLYLNDSEKLISTLIPFDFSGETFYRGFYQNISNPLNYTNSYGLGNFTDVRGNGEVRWGLMIDDDYYNIILGSSPSGVGLFIDNTETTLGYLSPSDYSAGAQLYLNNITTDISTSIPYEVFDIGYYKGFYQNTNNDIYQLGYHSKGNGEVLWGLDIHPGGIALGNTANANCLLIDSAAETVTLNGNLSVGTTIQAISLQGTGTEMIVADTDGYLSRQAIPSGSGDYLPLSGGTVTGNTIFQSGLTITSLSGATTRMVVVDTTGKLSATTISTPTQLGYYGAWQDLVTQTAAADNVGYTMIFRTQDIVPNGISIVNNGSSLPTRITFANTGIYNIQFSSEFQSNSTAIETITIWLRKNGVDVAGSAGVLTTAVKKAGSVYTAIASWNYLLDIIGGEYYELVWSTSNHTDITMQYYAAGSPPPAAASVILSVTQQSGIMAGTGITAINNLSSSVQTLNTGTTGSDFNIVSSISAHTFNIPNAGASARGLITTGIQSIAGEKTFLSSPIINTATASTITSFDVNKNLVSLSTATYPTLTELSYVKGITAATQTQINAKQTDSSWIDCSGQTLSGWSLITVRQMQYKLLGNKTAIFQFDIQGTGSGGNVNIALPFSASTWAGIQTGFYVCQQSVTTIGGAVMTASSSTMVLYTGPIGGNFTNGQTRNLRGTITINII